MIKRKLSLTLLTLLSAGTLAACGGGGTTDTTDEVDSSELISGESGIDDAEGDAIPGENTSSSESNDGINDGVEEDSSNAIPGDSSTGDSASE